MSPRNTNQDLLEIANVVQAAIQTAIVPLVAKINDLDNKVNGLALDRVTRSDIEKLRTELISSTVQKDVYETRHVSLIQRDSQIEESVRNAIRDYQEAFKSLQAQHQQEMQRLHERLESGKKQFEERQEQIEAKLEKSTKEIETKIEKYMDEIEAKLEKSMNEIETKIDNTKKAELSAKDQWWIRASILIAFVSMIVALFAFLVEHVHLN
jgi:DNA anti-recombination protein RmuC